MTELGRENRTSGGGESEEGTSIRIEEKGQNFISRRGAQKGKTGWESLQCDRYYGLLSWRGGMNRKDLNAKRGGGGGAER